MLKRELGELSCARVVSFFECAPGEVADDHARHGTRAGVSIVMHPQDRQDLVVEHGRLRMVALRCGREGEPNQSVSSVDSAAGAARFGDVERFLSQSRGPMHITLAARKAGGAGQYADMINRPRVVPGLQHLLQPCATFRLVTANEPERPEPPGEAKANISLAQDGGV